MGDGFILRDRIFTSEEFGRIAKPEIGAGSVEFRCISNRQRTTKVSKISNEGRFK